MSHLQFRQYDAEGLKLTRLQAEVQQQHDIFSLQPHGSWLRLYSANDENSYFVYCHIENFLRCCYGQNDVWIDSSLFDLSTLEILLREYISGEEFIIPILDVRLNGFCRLEKDEQPRGQCVSLWHDGEPSDAFIIPLKQITSAGYLSEPVSNSCKQLALPLSAIAGEICLTASEIHQLTTGDVVLLHKPRFAMLYEEHMLFTYQFNDQGIVVETVLAEPECLDLESDDEMLDQPAESSAKITLGELPVRVRVVLAEITLSLSEFEQLNDGDLIPLPGLLTTKPIVELRAGNQRFACGELVDVNGTLGVEIHSINQD